MKFSCCFGNLWLTIGNLLNEDHIEFVEVSHYGPDSFVDIEPLIDAALYETVQVEIARQSEW